MTDWQTQRVIAVALWVGIVAGAGFVALWFEKRAKRKLSNETKYPNKTTQPDARSYARKP